VNIDLTGKRALVSGSTQGIGRVIAARLAAAGAVTTINGRSAKRVEAVTQEDPEG
jgi:NAD(P)-dependent dehydrogenase (short-subunit alcohol dehydrogenase family)